ncbi:MAG: sigma-70 family RNA polymerase sigma factor [Oscillospiraceae bacterium]|nr:sigma-70 family RNA polymerase sigma factor [Oscillospiraceae bacterium]
MQDDSRIIACLLRRDEQALNMIRNTYGKLCFRIAQQMLGSKEDAEECVNDMLLAVWRSVPPHQPESLEAYLVTLLRRAAMDRLRQMHSQKRGGRQLAAALDELSELLPAKDNVEQECSRRDLTEALRHCVDALPEKAQRIFLQRYLLAMPLRQIAVDNGMTLSAVKVLLHRTRKQMQELLRREGFDEQL